jgi:heterodisulfide reductase subunit B
MTSAIKAGAEVVVLNCPACYQQFDNNQKKAEKIDNKTFRLPVLYITELLALAFGENPDDLGLKFHRIRLTGFLEKHGFK